MFRLHGRVFGGIRNRWGVGKVELSTKVALALVPSETPKSFLDFTTTAVGLKKLGVGEEGAVVGSGRSAVLQCYNDDGGEEGAGEFPTLVLATSNLRKAVRNPVRWGGRVLESEGDKGMRCLVDGDGDVERKKVITSSGVHFAIYHLFSRNPVLGVVLAVDDVERAADFYENAIGLRRKPSKGGGTEVCLAGEDEVGTKLVLVEREGEEWGGMHEKVLVQIEVDDAEVVFGRVARRPEVELDEKPQDNSNFLCTDLDGYSLAIVQKRERE